MSVTPDQQRQIIGRYGAQKSWANTVDRTAKTRRARDNSPSSVEWHVKRLPEQFAHATRARKNAAGELARKAYHTGLAMKSAASRCRDGVGGAQ